MMDAKTPVLFDGIADENIYLGEIVTGEPDANGKWHLRAKGPERGASLGIAARNIDAGDSISFDPALNTCDIIHATTRVAVTPASWQAIR